MALVGGSASRTKGQLTKGVCQTVGGRRLSDSTMGGMGLGNMSDLGSRKVWDRIGMEGAYTAMTAFTLIVLDTSRGDTTAGSQDLPTSVP